MSHATQLHNRGYLADYMQIMNRCALPSNVPDEVYRQVHDRALATVKWTLEQALEEEVTIYLGRARYERRLQRRRPEETRSGAYTRELWTQYGCIPALRVPKLRCGNPSLPWQTIERYERCWGPFLDQQLLHYCLGHSLRDLQEAMQQTLGEVLSLEACNRLVLGLEQRATAFKMARLAAPPPIVLVDGLWLKLAVPTGEVKEDASGRQRAVKRQQKRVMLTALGIWGDGHWEILSWHLASQEDAPAWSTLVGALYTKGVTEETTQLVVSDGAKGLDKALYSHLYGVPHQRCIFHKIKNIADYLKYTDLIDAAGVSAPGPSRQAKQERKRDILADAGQIYATDVEIESRARAESFRNKWAEREPQAVAAFLSDFEQTLCYLSVEFPRAHVSLIRTTNLLERFHKEIRRKQRDIGMLQSAAGCDVLWYMVAMRETAKQRAACRGTG
jgi:transposase-like protein